MWGDLTVADAPRVRDFYTAVTGWSFDPVSMQGYDDFVMKRAGSPEPVAGVCHARGPNANLPAQWLIYVAVARLDDSLSACTAQGGRVLDGPRPQGKQRFAVIQDPAGACLGLIGD